MIRRLVDQEEGTDDNWLQAYMTGECSGQYKPGIQTAYSTNYRNARTSSDLLVI